MITKEDNNLKKKKKARKEEKYLHNNKVAGRPYVWFSLPTKTKYPQTGITKHTWQIAGYQPDSGNHADQHDVTFDRSCYAWPIC